MRCGVHRPVDAATAGRSVRELPAAATLEA
jgi:hypothetical protein